MRNTHRNTTLELQSRITSALGAALVLVVAAFAALSLFACAAPADAGGRTTGNSFSAAIYVQGNPNGRITATKGTLGVDERTATIYQNTNGAKAWSLIAVSGSAGVGDIDSITAGDALIGDCTSGDCTIDTVCGFGLSCHADDLDLRDDCQAGDYLVYTSFGESGLRWQCANDAGSHKLVRDVVATNNGGLATTLDVTDPTAFAEFVHLRTDCANGDVLKSGASGTTWTCSADSGGITNSAGANVLAKSNGTNLVASQVTDDGSDVTISAADDVSIIGGGAAGFVALSATSSVDISSTINGANAIILTATAGGISLGAVGGGANDIISLAGGDIWLTGPTAITGNTAVTGTLTASGNTTLGGTLAVTGAVSEGGTRLLTSSGGAHSLSSPRYDYAEEFIAINGSHFPTATSGAGAGTATAGTITTNSYPGILGWTTGTTSTGSAGPANATSRFAFDNSTSSVFEWIGGVESLSTAAQEYALQVGFIDLNALNQVDGCYFMYDRGNVASGGTNSSNLEKLSCWCASNSTRTTFLMDGTTVSNESFTTVNAPVSAVNWATPTGVLKLKVVVTGTTRAEFYVNGVKSCNINTNIPSGASRVTGYGSVITKSAGTTGVIMDTDYQRVELNLTSSR